MTIFIDKDGSEVEAFTQEEVDSKITEAKKEAEESKKEEIETLKTQFETSKTELKTAKEDLEAALKGKDSKTTNIIEMRKKIESLETEIGKVDGKIKEAKNEGNQQKIDDAITQLSGGDAELKKKIKTQYDRLSEEIKTPEDFWKVMTDAFTLATGAAPSNPLGSAAATGPGYVPPPPGMKGKGKLSEDGKEVGGKMGITEEEMKQHDLL